MSLTRQKVIVGVEVSNQKEDADVPHHTVEDVMKALEARGYERERRVTTDLSDGEKARQRRLEGVPAEDWDSLVLSGELLDDAIKRFPGL